MSQSDERNAQCRQWRGEGTKIRKMLLIRHGCGKYALSYKIITMRKKMADYCR